MTPFSAGFTTLQTMFGARFGATIWIDGFIVTPARMSSTLLCYMRRHSFSVFVAGAQWNE